MTSLARGLGGALRGLGKVFSGLGEALESGAYKETREWGTPVLMAIAI